jgi:uncharacterized protein
LPKARGNAEVESFAPFEELARRLMATFESDGDGAHDWGHLVRVWRNVKEMHTCEGGDLECLAAAVLLHDCVSVPKNSPERSMASRLAADKASSILTELEWDANRIQTVSGAILTHSYSAGMKPTSLEGRILQDADRLDAIGFVGIARCFYTAGRMGSQLYELSDPEGVGRVLDDVSFALDHFPLKLLRLAAGFQTPTGQRLAEQRHDACHQFYRGMLREICGGS